MPKSCISHISGHDILVSIPEGMLTKNLTWPIIRHLLLR